MRQDVNYTNPKAGKMFITLGKLARGASYLTGLAAITGMIVGGLGKDVEFAQESANYVQNFLSDLSYNRDALFMSSVITNISGGAVYGFGKWKNWRKNE